MTSTSATPQQKMQAKLAQSGIPAREIKVYGSQIMVTCGCRYTAEKWASLVARFAKVRAVFEAWDEAAQNRGTCLKPSMVKVWRVSARIA
jgi:hypothetical protein